MSFSNFLRDGLSDHALGRTDFVAPLTLYFGLSRADPGFTGTANSEHSGDAYARVALPNSDNLFAAAVAGIKRTNAAITFPEASGSWGLVSFATIWTAVTSVVPLRTVGTASSKPITIRLLSPVFRL